MAIAPVVVRRGAIFDPIDPAYRYVLWRDFVDNPMRTCLWVMLNPSTATALFDDPTIRRCQRFSHRWGMDSCRVVNIFALRSTDPHGLTCVKDPIGPQNDAYILEEARRASVVVCAWGEWGVLHDRSTQIRALLRDVSPLHCLKINKGGQPAHPLYQRDDVALQRYL